MSALLQEGQSKTKQQEELPLLSRIKHMALALPTSAEFMLHCEQELLREQNGWKQKEVFTEALGPKESPLSDCSHD